jgi:hypothetical protein
VGEALELRDLAELELDRSLPAEDVDEDLELELILVDLGDLAREVGEWAFFDPHRLTDLVLEARTTALGRGVATLHLDLQDALDLTPRQRGRLGSGTDEAGDSGGVADNGPAVVVQLAAAKQVAREYLLLDDDLLAATSSIGMTTS